MDTKPQTHAVLRKRTMPCPRPTRLPFFPVLREGELLYSGIARFYHLLGGFNARYTLRLITGRNEIRSRTAGAPAYIAAFAERLPIHHPNRDAEILLNRHTVVPMLTYFLDRRSREAVRNRFLTDGSPPASLAMLGHTVRRHMHFHRSLAFCPTCVMQDAEQFGTPHWHVEHQLPGVFICPMHGKRLAIGCERHGLTANSVYRAELPPMICLRKRHPSILVPFPAGVPDHEITLLAGELAEMLKRPMGAGVGSWVEASRIFLLKMGFGRVSVLDRVRIHDHLRSRFSDALLRWVGFSDDERSRDYSWISKLFNWRKRAAVLNCLVFILAFYESLAGFEEAAKKFESSDALLFQDDVWNASWDTDRTKRSHQASNLRRAASSLETTLGAVLRGKVGGSRQDQRKRDLLKRTLDFVLSEVKSGASINSIARHLRVRSADIRRHLEPLHPKVLAEVTRSAFLRTRNRHRVAITNYLARNPLATRTELSRSLPQCVPWIRKFDGDWYESNNFRIPPRGKIWKPPTEDNDLAFAERLKVAADALIARESLPRLSTHALLTEAAATCRERLHVIQMPRSAAEIAEHVETREDWWRRRIRIYVATAGSINCKISSNRIKQEHQLPKTTPKWMRDFIRDEATRQGFTWVAGRSG